MNTNNKTIRELKKNGYKQNKTFPFLLVNSTGNVFDVSRNRLLKPNRRGTVKAESQYINIPKLMLETFGSIPYREHSHVVFLDGNSNNLDVSNVSYRRIFDNTPENINFDSLYRAIRCYFEVSKGYHVRDIVKTKCYLTSIAEHRNFIHANRSDEHIGLFEDYLKVTVSGKVEIAQKYNMTIRDVDYVVNGFINKLASEILSDMEKGVLSIKEYRKRIRTKTDKGYIRDWEKIRKELRRSG